MACSCQGKSGQYEVVTSEGTVPATVGSFANAFTSLSAANAALTASGVGGYVRQRAVAGAR